MRTLWCARSTAAASRRRRKSEPSETKQQATAGLSTEAALGLELAVAVVAVVDLSTTTKTRLLLQACQPTESLTTQITRKRFTRSVALRVGCGRSVDTNKVAVLVSQVLVSDYYFCFSVLLLICEIWNKNEL
jgi:hypothetical protein